MTIPNSDIEPTEQDQPLFDTEVDDSGDVEHPQEPEIDPDSPQGKLNALLQSNGEKVRELVNLIGPSAIQDINVKLINLRLSQVTELVFQAIGNQHRGPFYIEHEVNVSQLLDALLEQARQAILTAPLQGG